MYHVIGVSPPEQQYLWPVRVQPRFRFDTRDFRTHGYFWLLGRFFEPLAQRHAEQSLFSINTLLALRESDMDEAISALDEAEERLRLYPNAWREHVCDMHPPRGAPVVRVEPMLLRSRALSLAAKIRGMVTSARFRGDNVVYGNGVSYRHLCGIPLPPGVVEYS